jgi:uncharacterized protein YciI
MELETYELVLLRRPEDATEYDDETLERIQREHLEFYDRMRAEGHVATNGPVMDQPDTSLRGLAFFRVGSLPAARELAEMDPAVVAGRIVNDVMTWWCLPGSMAQPGTPITVNP